MITNSREVPRLIHPRPMLQTHFFFSHTQRRLFKRATDRRLFHLFPFLSRCYNQKRHQPPQATMVFIADFFHILACIFAFFLHLAEQRLMNVLVVILSQHLHQLNVRLQVKIVVHHLLMD